MDEKASGWRLMWIVVLAFGVTILLVWGLIRSQYDRWYGSPSYMMQMMHNNEADNR